MRDIDIGFLSVCLSVCLSIYQAIVLSRNGCNIIKRFLRLVGTSFYF